MPNSGRPELGGRLYDMQIWKIWLCAAALAFGLPGASDDAQAQSFPSRAITLVIPFAPGGSTSIVGRVIADKMSELIGEKVVVDNRPGAGGTVGTKAVAKSEPDGYTIALGYTGTLAIGPSLYKNAGYDPRQDRGRADRLCQGQSWQGQFRLRRRGHGEPYHRRIFRRFRRHQAGPHSLQGHRPGADRSVGWTYPDGVRADPRVSPQCYGRIAARAGGDQHDPFQPAAGGADNCRAGIARFRRVALLRPGGAGRHAAARDL